MRIGFILDGDFRHDSRVKNEARILENSGHSVFVLNPGFPGLRAEERYSESILIRRLPVIKKYINYLYALENLLPLYDRIWSIGIKRLIKEYQLDSIHIHDLYLARAGKMAAKTFRLPVILDLHENYPAAVMQYRWATRFPARLIVRPEKWQKKEKKYLSGVASIIVLSNNFRNELISKYPFLNTSVIFVYPNVPDINQLLSYKPDSGVFPKKDRFVLFYFGVISERRGIKTTVEALRKLVNKHPQLHLLLIGPIDKAEKENFENLFSEPDLKEHITHFPWKDISELPSFLEGSDICLSPLVRNPQHDSGVANKIFQYMLFKKPILVSDCLPQKEIIEINRCGRYFRNCDASDMATVIEEMMTTPGEIIDMGERGHKAVIEVFNTVVQGKEVLKAHDSGGFTSHANPTETENSKTNR